MGLVGLQATLVDVEASVGGGLPRTVIVGLPDAALNEARERCRAALGNSGLGTWPQHLVTINLSPASLPKAGTHFDLAILAAILVASIRLHFLDTLLHLSYPGPNEVECDAPFTRGQEIGWFEHGSTLILFAPAGFRLAEGIGAGSRVRMGQSLMRLPDGS